MGAFGVILALVTASLTTQTVLGMGNLLPNTFPLGKIGCLFAKDMCDSDQICIDDDLFGNCQLGGSVTYDTYKYEPDAPTLEVLVSELTRLIDNTYTWHDGYTQCIIQHLLLASRERTIYDPRICEKGRKISNEISDLDADIANLIRDLYNDHDSSVDAVALNAKRNQLVRIHKYDGEFAAKQGQDQYRSDRGNVAVDNEASEAYNVLDKLSSSDLLVFQSYLKALANEESREKKVDDFIAGLSEVVPPMTPRYAKILSNLIEKKLEPEDLNDDDLHMMSEIMAKIVSNLEKTKKMSSNNGGITPQQIMQDQQFPLRRPSVTPYVNQSHLMQLSNTPDKKVVSSANDSEGLSQVLSSADASQNGNKAKKSFSLDPRFTVTERNLHGDTSQSARTSATTKKNNNLKDVDLNYAYIDMQNSISLPQAVSIMRWLEKAVNISPGTLELDKVENNIITLRVPPERTDVTAQTIAAAAVHHKNDIMDEFALTVVSSGFGNQISRVNLDDLSHHRRYFVVTFVLCGTVAVILVSVVAIYLVRRHSRSKQKLAQLASNGDAVEASKDYQDLCRQRMQAKTSEKPEPINAAAAASRISSVSESQVRSPSSRSSTSSWSEEPVVSNMDISTGHIVLSYMESHLKNKDRLDEEWRSLSSYEADPCSTSVAKNSANARKNRYPDILPYDHSRVVLTDATNVTQSDYINASTITDHDPRNPAYIATQAPLPHTVADFWQMVWEQGSAVIVMLTKMTENGVTTCHRYWPEEGSDLYHIYEVHLVSEHIWCDDYLVRSFYLKNLETNETRTVTQFHFLTWPENKTAPTIKSLLDFRRKVNKSYRGRSCPVMVHCNDGSGRTGTYCLLDMVLNRLAKGAKEIDIAATLEHIRDQRMAMVKTKEQFEFALACVAEEVHAILKALPQ